MGKLYNAVFNILPISRPKRFRLIDRRSLVEENTLIMYETLCIPKDISFTIISSICTDANWNKSKQFKINNPDLPQYTNRFDIPLTLKNLPIEARSDFLWIPDLCIRPGDRSDASWHFARTLEIFTSSSACSKHIGIDRPTSLQIPKLWPSYQWAEDSSKRLSDDVLSGIEACRMTDEPYDTIQRWGIPTRVAYYNSYGYSCCVKGQVNFEAEILLCITDFFKWGVESFFRFGSREEAQLVSPIEECLLASTSSYS